jgi:glycosyltransferase involved in cell wall biosynthesis
VRVRLAPGEDLLGLAEALAPHDVHVVGDDDGPADVAVGTDLLVLAGLDAPVRIRRLDDRPADPTELALAVPTLVTARWLAALLGDLGVPARHVTPPLGAPVAADGPVRAAGGPLRVRVLGAGDAVLANTREPDVAVVEHLAEADVVLDLTRHERLPSPVLVGAAHGATAVATAAPGREEVVEHGVTGLVVAWDDPRGAAHALDLLARDRDLLAQLRAGALARARAWPDAPTAAAALADALRALAAAPPADPAALRAAARTPPPQEPHEPPVQRVHRGGLVARPRVRRLLERLR